MHAALAILLSALLAEIVSWIGKERIINALHYVFVRLFHSNILAERRRLKTDIYTMKQELDKTSSQDEFAKWAKLRRKVDKSIQDLEKLNASLTPGRSTLPMLIKAFLFLLTTVLPFGVKTYHRKTPVFWLPPGDWFGPIGWAASLPGAPAGSISATVWGMVCSRILVIVASTAKDLFVSST
ncbi:unnamed protein product [Tilletia laevis]|uniref:Guided entry of tail-anchored proteins 1 n=3 Tax=Tilletia TaxID=13289 RepID=A0A8X7SZD5_9BASI|nr:hypothetical protein CF336_g1095 [Tilletia laevis]KAE8205512.1 hypothetical protein CF328_g461 [Tilletia controversa]KAE8265428.1 hypothetical protein A4X03_0g270 [Tilletia caries]KAE8208166.1 hypothetical protein CF335_g617 [Tilletia laevis]KAE8253576.1 hypothetical protein A4X06_0g1350 [Tilletia controversa]